MDGEKGGRRMRQYSRMASFEKRVSCHVMLLQQGYGSIVNRFRAIVKLKHLPREIDRAWSLTIKLSSIRRGRSRKYRKLLDRATV
jgi:hypothetical protein